MTSVYAFARRLMSRNRLCDCNNYTVASSSPLSSCVPRRCAICRRRCYVGAGHRAKTLSTLWRSWKEDRRPWSGMLMPTRCCGLHPNKFCWQEPMAVLLSRTIRVSRTGEEGVEVFNCLLPSHWCDDVVRTCEGFVR